MYSYIAIVEATRQMNEQFHDMPVNDRLDGTSAQPVPVRTRVRVRLSTTLHALANAVEPAPPVCEPVASQQH